MTDDTIEKAIQGLKSQIERLQAQRDIDKMQEQDTTQDEQEGETEKDPMRSIDMGMRDKYNEPIDAMTSTRFNNDSEIYNFAAAKANAVLHGMAGNRYGKHSLLIPKEDANDQIRQAWKGHKQAEIKIDGREYLKIGGVLRTEIIRDSIQIMRISAGGGLGRYEAIQHKGAGLIGEAWLNEKMPIRPKFIPAYGNKKSGLAEQAEKIIDNND